MKLSAGVLDQLKLPIYKEQAYYLSLGKLKKGKNMSGKKIKEEVKCSILNLREKKINQKEIP